MTSLTHTIPPQTFSIADKHPSIAGHFPGNPLVAGAILLTRAQQHLQSYIKADINSVSRLRFNQPVLPEQDIYVEYQQKNDHQWRFSGLVNNEPAFKGVFSCAEPFNDAPQLPAVEESGPNILAADLYQHLPHGGNMQLIKKVKAWDEHSIHCQTNSHLSRSNPLLDASHLPATSAIEYAAQALALHGVIKKQAKGLLDQANKAFVVSAKGLHFDQVNLSQFEQTLDVSATVLIGNSQSAVYSVQVSAGDHCFLKGDLGVMSHSG